jgi:hypothetical protein
MNTQYALRMESHALAQRLGSTTSSSGQCTREGVVVLDTPIQPISITAGMSGTMLIHVFASPKESAR